MAGLEEVLDIEIKELLPAEGAVGITYKLEGTVRMLDDAIGAPPWVYAEVKKKDWYKPEIVEETDYKRGFPIPISGDFSIKWEFEKSGIYDVTVVATPAPLSLPLIGVPPVLGKSDMMKITVAAKAETGLEILSCSFA